MFGRIGMVRLPALLLVLMGAIGALAISFHGLAVAEASSGSVSVAPAGLAYHGGHDDGDDNGDDDGDDNDGGHDDDKDGGHEDDDKDGGHEDDDNDGGHEDDKDGGHDDDDKDGGHDDDKDDNGGDPGNGGESQSSTVPPPAVLGTSLAAGPTALPDAGGAPVASGSPWDSLIVVLGLGALTLTGGSVLTLATLRRRSDR